MTTKNSKLKDTDKQLLLNLAYEAVKSKLENREVKIPADLPESLKQRRATFVTLMLGNKLRGCIGHLLPVQALYLDMIENARAAAFSDPRFIPLTRNELAELKIEISILNLPQKINFQSPEELTKYLQKVRPGVVLRKGHCQATFLPQIWDDLPAPEDFLTRLCLKAGLTLNAWRTDAQIETYAVEKIV